MFVKISNGNPEKYTLGELRRDNPNTSFPKRIPDEMLAEWGVYPVTLEDKPSYTERTQTVTKDAAPTGSGSSWTIGWTVSDKTAAEVQEYDDAKAQENRSQRDKLLSDTDWTALSDVTMSAAMATYRQALRDITDHAAFPHLAEADWPTKPE